MEYTDSNGQFWPIGRIRSEYRSAFFDQAPIGSGESDWLSSPSGTVAIDPPATTAGGLNLSTAATIGATAQLQTAAQFQLRYFRSIRWYLDGLRIDGELNTMDVEVFLGGSGAACGARIFQLAADTQASVQWYGSGPGSDAPSSFMLRIPSANQQQGSRNLSFEVRGRAPQEANILVWQGDQVIYARAMPLAWASQAGTIQPGIRIKATTAASAKMKIAQARLVVQKNA